MRRVLVLLPLLSIACDAPGRGAKAQDGYRRAAPVLSALAAYYRDSGSYPRTLPQLIPQYLGVDALAIPKPAQEAYPLEYARTGPSYRLTFRYVGPGVNKCVFQPSTRWVCSGRF